jgi:2,4-dienoyl-CoA reductase (NADPH2)
VLQLAHSGRYSKPEGKPKPRMVHLNPFLDKQPHDQHVLSDEELDQVQDKYVETSRLAYQAGFDAVDIKACHGYLLNELLAAFTRKNSRYGGSFDSRTRFLREVIQEVRREVPGIYLAVRLNAYDGIPYPYGFGVSKDGSLSIDLSEPIALVRRLVQLGCSLFNITVGNPYDKPHLGRPFDRPLPSATFPEEHPLEGVSRLLRITAEFQKAFSKVPFVGTGYSWLRHFHPHVGAAIVEGGEAFFIGLGRSSFAYPDAPKDLMSSGAMDPKKVCITCSRCSALMRTGHISGCAVRDKKIYSKEYQKLSSSVLR